MPRMQISRRHTVKSKYLWMLSRASRPPLTCHTRALRLHPDKGGDPELFKEVTHAYVSLTQVHLESVFNVSSCSYEVLADPDKRAV